MQQRLSEYDDRDDGLRLVDEDRTGDFSRPDRRLPAMLVTLLAMALFAGGLWFAYVQGTRHPAANARGDGVPLIRADERPAKVRPDQPGGMAVPDQNVSLYNEKPGGSGVEKLLPAAEQPMPRPAPLPREAAIPPASLAPPVETATPQPALPVAPPAPNLSAAPPGASPTKSAAPKVAPQPAAKAPPQPKQPAPRAPATAAAPAGKASPVQLRLGALRSPEAAREEWARLKRENPDLLGKLSAVAVRTDLGDQGIYYRIQAGSFGDGAAAEKLCGELKRRKLGCILAR
jgi:sporulation related protein